MNRRLNVMCVVLGLLAIPSVATAEFRRIEIKTLGMDWAVCAHAVRVAMKKVPGVESVEVSLDKAMTDIRLAAGNTVTMSQLRDIIRSSGFNAHEANITATGRVSLKNDQVVADLAPARVTLRIQPGGTGTAESEARTLAGSGSQEVEMSGVIRQGDELSLTSIKRR